MPDRPTCPRCGTPRLIQRVEVGSPRLGDGLVLYLRFRLRRRPGSIRRTHYVCELCGHTWRTFEPAG